MIQYSRGFRYSASAWLALAIAATSGCTNSASKTTSPEDKSAAPTPKTQPVGKAPPKADPPVQTAVAALRELIEGLRAGKPQVLWDFLPPSYQRDVNEVVHEFAGLMDAELWNRTFAVAARAHKLLKSRKREILSAPAWEQIQDLDHEKLKKEYDGLLALAEIVIGSEFADLEKLKTIDIGRFLKTTDAGVFTRLPGLSKKLPSAGTVKLVVGNDSEAELQVSAGDDVNTVKLIRVEGKWVHSWLAEGWENQIQRIRQELKTKLDPKKLAARKKIALKVFTDLEARLSQLEKAKTADEFQQRLAASPLLGFLVAMFRDPGSIPGVVGTAFPESAKSASKGGKKLTVLVIVEGVFDRKTTDKIGDALFKLGAYDLGDVIVNGKTTVFPISEVGDFEELRKQLRFADVISADSKKLEIRIRLRQKK